MEWSRVMKRRKKRRLMKRIIRVCMLLMVLVVLGKVSLELFPKTARIDNGWNLILVNQKNKIPKNYEVELRELSNGKQVDERIYEPLITMLQDGAEEGYFMVVVEAFRTEEEQQSLMDEKVEAYMDEGYPKMIAKEMAEKWVAVPGTSEHQLGIAVDINPDYDKSGKEVYDWLAENAHEYGFIYRYPEDKVHITGIMNEPWHYRYVGEAAAEEIYEQGICLEEYLD